MEHIRPWHELKEKLSCFRDIIAYRIVIALPKCHLKPGQNLEEEEMKYLYQIANALPGFWKNALYSRAGKRSPGE